MLKPFPSILNPVQSNQNEIKKQAKHKAVLFIINTRNARI